MSTDDDPPPADSPASADDEPLVQPAGDALSDPGTAGGGEAAPAADGSSLPSDSLPEYESPASVRSRQRREAPNRRDAPNMLPGRDRRRSGVERLLVRLIATGGIVGIGVAIAAIMVSSKSQGWVVGLVVSIVTVVLAGVLWSSRQL